MKKTPHKVILTEDQMPQRWFNLRAAMPEQPDPMLRPDTLQPAVSYTHLTLPTILRV